MHSLASLAAFSQSPLPPWHALFYGGDENSSVEIYSVMMRIWID